MLNKLENMLNELKQVLESKKELLKNLLNDKKINDNKDVTKEQVLKGQEINSKIYHTEFSIEKTAGDVREQERLIEEAKDYLNNKSIVYEDFLTLCDIYNIKVAARTKGHLKNADACIKLDGYTLPKKMRVSDTVLKLSEELYNALLQDQEPKENKINDLLEDTEEKFYIKNESGEYEQVAGVRLENKYNFDLFYHEIALSNYIITHAPTGVAISGTITGHKEDLLNKLDVLVEKNGMNNILKMFSDVISKEGYAPGKQIKEEFYNNKVLTENYYISTNPGNKQLVIIQGNNATINHLQGKTIWKRQEKDIIKDLGHSSIKDYIKHLKKFNFKEIQDITEYKAAEQYRETSEVNMNLQLLATKKEVKQSRVNKALERHNLAIKRAEHFYNTIDDKIEEYKNANEHLYKYYIELKEIYKTDLIKVIDDKINFINKLDNYNIVQDEGVHEDLQNELKPIYNDDIEGHKEYQIEQLKLYNSNTLNFQKKRITHKMIEQCTKYFIYDNKTFMAVKPSKDGIYPTGYYQHVKQYDSLVDIDNKIILFRDHGTLESLEEVQNV